MDTTSQAAAPGGDNSTPASDPSLSAAAECAFDLAQRWRALLDVEIVLARCSLRALLIGGLALPVLALSTWLAIMALMTGTVYILSGSWLFALLLAVVAQLSLLVALLLFLRRWSRDLTLPQSRDALIRALAAVA